MKHLRIFNVTLYCNGANQYHVSHSLNLYSVSVGNFQIEKKKDSDEKDCSAIL